MSKIIQELLVEILVRLPVQTLLRCRCVSKSWRDLIDGQDFIHKHIKYSIETKTNLHVTFTLFASHCVFMIHFDEVFNRRVTISNFPWDSSLRGDRIMSYDDFKELTKPSILKVSCEPIDQVVGSCNGLVCVKFSNHSFALWNPFTRKYKMLPDVPLENLKIRPHYGYGYDHVNDDYKVVKIMEFINARADVIANEVKVYSSKMNSWKKIQSAPYSGRKVAGSTGTFVNGSLHWFMSHGALTSTKPELLVAFNLEREEFSELPFPEYIKGGSDSYTSLEVLGGCLCVCFPCFRKQIDVWIMKEYGVGDSWSKLYTIKGEHYPKAYGVPAPLEYSMDGERILFTHSFEGLMWYNLKEDSRVTFCDIPRFLNGKMCIASLVSPGEQIEIEVKRKYTPSKKKRLSLESSCRMQIDEDEVEEEEEEEEEY